jgi:hypothetical protein
MKRIHIVVLSVILVASSLPARATSSLELGPAGGISRFNGAGTPLVGWGIKVEGLDNGSEYLPVKGNLSFRTGKLISSKPNEWIFGGGGTITIAGCVDWNLNWNPAHKWCDSHDYSGVVLNGTFLHAILTSDRNGSKTLRAFFVDEFSSGLAQFLGASGTLSQRELDLNFTGNGMSSAYSNDPTRILSGYMKAAPVPEPSSLPMLGSGLAAIGIFRLRRLRTSTS